MKEFKKKTRMTLRQAEKFFRDGGSEADFKAKNTALSGNGLKDLKEAALLLKESRDFIDNFKERYISEALRYGYIGKKISDSNGSEFVQISRGGQYGYLAAVIDDKKTLYAGIAYISEDEKYRHPVIGHAIALKRAIENREKGILMAAYEDLKTPFLKSGDVLQYEHFFDRACRYFLPEEYSYSRGKSPVESRNFDDIHVWQYAVKAQNAGTDEEFTNAIKKLADTLRKTNKNLNKIK